ncbi:hypothetical protein [Xenorhabdus bovienii]|uniref:Uncharacterized protein n=2 Tax=Xenorhabdus bovienii TaxID=40576 RepID=A0A077NDZ2_XENBV|nr:hypothetical protein [Xenorhabdus bovienii]CDG87573.1 hypothetical protein XBFFR1_1860002 [Xenorhabdus bovienii str. feltiae France]CDG92577.1 hypothetical protein XBFFL1_2260002 [Xenorhabdus bovienii str. feltiae Florida]CDG97109.1 hypothetical protein XBP1_2480001 [Xenorhabdus bovienii str. puntauvense]
MISKPQTKKQVIKSDDFLTVPRSAVLKKELQQLEQHLNTMKAEWQKKFDLLELVYELEAHFLVEESSND